jgi:hypothetical protein
VFLLCLPRKNLSSTEQMMFDAMSEEQKQRVSEARELRHRRLWGKPIVIGSGRWRHIENTEHTT